MNEDYGLLPRIWGPHMWKSLHCISFNYPTNPTPEKKKQYRSFFEMLGHVLPCDDCSKSYLHLISDGPTQITDDIFESRKTLTKWVCDIHQKVNNKLDADYDITFNEICERYESFRVKCDQAYPGCKMTTEMKKVSFCNEYKKDCTIIPYNIAKLFSNYAKKRGVNFDIINEVNNCLIDKNKSTLCDENWDKRNKYCDTIIKEMRQFGIPSIETDYEFKGLPTIHELILLSYMSSNLLLSKLIKVSKLLTSNDNLHTKKYKFS